MNGNHDDNGADGIGEDLMRYDLLAEAALKHVVRMALWRVQHEGLPGEHHFFIAFDTRHPGVRLSERLRNKYPEEMTIVLQHQFWDLKVRHEGFEVGLAFGGVPEKLWVPFEAITGFYDPSVQFALQFRQPEEMEKDLLQRSGQMHAFDGGAEIIGDATPRATGGKAAGAPAGDAAAKPVHAEQMADEKATDEKVTEQEKVVSLDAFRKKT